MDLPKYILDIIDTLNQNGYEAYVVGGCVRDYLMHKEPHDYDICTQARPEEILNLFDHTIPTGMKHGTISILSETLVEVTTFRTESQYTDHRHPDQVEFVTNIEQDLARRDFTINAMAYHPEKGLVDPYHGQEDLENRMIRCVGNPEERFQEDALRMIRAHRFAATLNFKIEKHTLEAIQYLAPTIEYVSIERIRSELIRILEKNPYEIENMTELLSKWMPELKQCQDCEQNTPWHDANVLHHILKSVTYLIPFDETLAFTLLFHDLGKPMCKNTMNGIDHFKGHPEAGYEISKRICRDLKLTNQQRHDIPLLVKYHDVDMKGKNPLKVIYTLRVQNHWSDDLFKKLIQVKYCDIMAHSVYGRQSLSVLDALKNVYEDCLKNRPMELSDLAITGQAVIQCGFKGKDIQRVLQNCLEYAFYHPEKNEKLALLEYIEEDGLWKY